MNSKNCAVVSFRDLDGEWNDSRLSVVHTCLLNRKMREKQRKQTRSGYQKDAKFDNLVINMSVGGQVSLRFDSTEPRLAQLLTVIQRLVEVTDPPVLIQAALETVLQLFSATACSVALVNPSERQLTFAFTLGGAKVEEFPVPFGQGLVGWVVAHGQAILCNDVSQEPRFYGFIDRQTGFRTRTILCAPLIYEYRSIGAVEVLNTTSATGFTEEDLELLHALAGLLSPILSRTKVFATLVNANTVAQEVVDERYHLVTGTSPAAQEVLRTARSVAVAPTTVLLLGESGTGKEVLARAIHRWSPRAEQPFVAVNCVALTPELLESELFGHEKGAFTGAVTQKKGRFELADSGTIFLDEIGDLAPNLQAKLLRVLQEREFQRVGGTKDIRVDVRVIAATNRNLRQAMEHGTFREDLYYRLNVVEVALPPLRDRREDIPFLIDHFLTRFCRDLKRAPLQIDPATRAALHDYHWPGNIRELQNVIERAVVLSAGLMIRLEDLPHEIRTPCQTQQPVTATVLPATVEEPRSLGEATDAFQRDMIRQALSRAGGNQAEAARMLGLARSNLSRLMKRLGIR